MLINNKLAVKNESIHFGRLAETNSYLL